MDTLKAFHHWYIGLAILIADFYLIWSRWAPAWLNWSLFWLAWIIMTDDFYQHMRQRNHPEYRSPLHKLYGMFYKIKFIRWLNGIFDWIFGKGE